MDTPSEVRDLELTVHYAYIAVTLLTAAANGFSATCDFVRYERVRIAMAKAGVPESWMTPLGLLKAAGALGLLVGFAIPAIGIAAAIGLVLFFIGAIVTHIWVRDYSYGLATIFLLLAIASLSLGLMAHQQNPS